MSALETSAQESPRRSPARRGRVIRSIAVAPIVLYRYLVSPLIPRRCKYEPTCSSYALEAIRQYGILRGFVLAGWRLLRCNPWSYGGYDPVEAQRVFKVRPLAASGADAVRRSTLCPESPPRVSCAPSEMTPRDLKNAW